MCPLQKTCARILCKALPPMALSVHLAQMLTTQSPITPSSWGTIKCQMLSLSNYLICLLVYVCLLSLKYTILESKDLTYLLYCWIPRLAE